MAVGGRDSVFPQARQRPAAARQGPTRAQVKQAYPSPVERLMLLVPSLPRFPRLRAEQSVQVAFVTQLRRETLAGRIRGVWTAVCHETPISAGMLPDRLVWLPSAIQAVFAHMGCVKGASDFWFVGPRGHSGLVVEFKRPKEHVMKIVDGSLRKRLDAGGTLSNEQRDFRDWCQLQDVPRVTCRSPEEAFEALRTHGLWTPPAAVPVQSS